MYPVYAVPANDVLPIFFSTYGKTNGESITLTGLLVSDIEIYKDGGVTQRASDAGYTLLDTDGIDFDAITGIHGFSIDTGDNTDAGFYTVGAWFHVVVSAVTVDGQTVNFVAAAFRIMAAEGVAGVPDVNATHISDTAQTANDVGADVDAILVDTGTTLDGRIPAALVSGRMDSSVGAMAANVLTAAAINTSAISRAKFDVDTGLVTIRSSTAQAGAAGTITLDASASAVDDFYNGAWVFLTGATGVGQARLITDYVGSTKVASVAPNWVTNPDATSTFAILPAARIDGVDTKLDAIDDFLDTEIADILTDTGTTLDDLVDDLEGRLTAALATALQAHGLGIGRGVVDVLSTTTLVIIKSVNGAAASGTDDFYNNRHIVFTSGTLTLQATEITDYTGATKTATVAALTSAPAEDVSFIIV